MASKTVPISARISHEDAEFISHLKINGAATPSDKLRAIIADARKKSIKRHDYLEYLNIMQDLIAPANDTIKNTEHNQHMHSELVSRLIEWLPEICAYLLSASTPEKKEMSSDLLVQLEDGLSDRVFRLFESVLQMGVTRRCPCYNDKLIDTSVGPVLDLVHVINLSRTKEEGEQ